MCDTLNFKHISQKPFQLDRDRQYTQPQACFSKKPSGLWLSVGDSWQRWCVLEGFQYDKPDDVFHTYQVEVDMTDILIIDETNIMAYPNYNWEEISSRYKGVAVLEYDWSKLRFAYMWYYMLDCECACIWDLSCVKSVEKIPNTLYSLFKAIEDQASELFLRR